MKKLAIALLFAMNFYSTTTIAQTVNLVCEINGKNYVVYFGNSIRISLNLAEKIAIDHNVITKFRESESYLRWDSYFPPDGSTIDFTLDRTTLLLLVNGNTAPIDAAKTSIKFDAGKSELASHHDRNRAKIRVS